MSRGDFLAHALAEMERASVLSLDIFDTSLFRKVHEPTDIFLVMEQKVAAWSGSPDPGFRDLRRGGEQEAMDRSGHPYRQVSLENIYTRLREKTGWSPELIDRVTNLEIETELRFLYPNPDAVALYQAARAAGKRVVFLSDMYLPSPVLARFLEAHGFAQPEVFVSCENGGGKGRGVLFEKVQDRLGLPPGNFLHIGDRYYADYLCARAKGWHAIHFRPPTAADIHLPKPSLDAVSRVLLGLRRKSAGAAGNSPEEALWRQLGYHIAGPLYFGFGRWLCGDALRHGIDRMLLCSRDGFPLIETMRILKEAWKIPVETHYFYASRRLFNLARIRDLDESNVEFLLMPSPKMHLRDVVLRCGLKPEEQEEKLRALGFESMDMPVTSAAFGRFLKPSYRENLEKWLDQIRDELFAAISRERELIFRYFDEVNIEQPGTSVVDLGWNGTVCESVQELIRFRRPGFNLKARFFGSVRKASHFAGDGGQIESYFLHLGKPERREHLINECVELIELLFCAPHGTIIGLKQGGQIEPIYGTCEFSPKQRDQLTWLHAGGHEFVREAAGLLGPPETGRADNAGADFIEAHLEQIMRRPTRIEAEALGSMPHRHTYGDQGGLRKLAEVPQNHANRVAPLFPLAMAFGESYWKWGFLAQLTPARAFFVRGLHFLRSIFVAATSGTLWKSAKWALGKRESE